MALLDGRVAVVTGAGRGLGRAHALALAAEGAVVVVNDADGPAAEAVVAEIGAVGGAAATDHTALGSVDDGARLVEAAAARFGRVDVVVNNAGISRPTPVDALDDAVLDAHLGVHLKATIGTTRAAFPGMRDRGWGRVVNTVSGAGLDPQHPASAAYAIAKAGVYAFTKVAAVEGAGHGITVNAVSPLAVTRMSEAFFARAEPEVRQRLDPARVADVVAFLASDLAAAVNGRILRVEGGHVSEAHMTWTEGAYAERWDAATLAERLDDFLRRSS